MTTRLSIDRAHTAVLIMDYQNDIVSGITSGISPGQDGLLDRASSVLGAARRAGLPIVYVVVGFREWYPEVGPRNRRFNELKAGGGCVRGRKGPRCIPRWRRSRETWWSPSGEWMPSLQPTWRRS